MDIKKLQKVVMRVFTVMFILRSKTNYLNPPTQLYFIYMDTKITV